MASERRYFGTDGIRGEVGIPPITPDFVMKLGWAAGRVLANGEGSRVLVGKDTRSSGYMFEAALEAGLSAAGVGTQLLGPMPTPAIAYLTRTLRAKAGIVISASHNPFADNGIKFFSADGSKLPDEVEFAIEAQLDEPLRCVSPQTLGKATRVTDAAGRYIEFCKGTLPARASFRGLTLVVDCAHGATYHIAPAVFSELGAKVYPLGTDPDGININEACGATAPEALAREVVARGADLGIALDGDGDRLIMVDHRGGIVDGDELTYIIAAERHRTGQLEGAIVGTLMSNMGLELAVRALGLGFHRAKVGDRYILEMLKENHLTLGGESSGHIICLDLTTTGDGIVSALQVIQACQRSGRTLAELRAGMTRLPQRLVNVRCGAPAAAAGLAPVQAAVREAEVRLNGRGRVLLRPSGTEPVVRVMVEGEDDAIVAALAQEIAEVVASSVTPA
ncbi:MAG TPA: phosphoglucosamine mutase [Gammaproteobacteria bacterium]|nr:phosphoglucosamine mutase [Gammaproteobacteria bacterium]